ncbi:MAG: hypothetical protein HY904_13705 [Deltaproteobacteria bacterium]|nr:hypothetical protein [Deltaproteobacteria bacterium]
MVETRVHGGRWLAVLATLAALQVPGCWCEPVLPEPFNTFPEPQPGTAADFCAAWAGAACAHAQRCDPATYAAVDVEGCEPAMTARCERERAPQRAAEQQGRMHYDKRHARGCIEFERDRACDQAPSPSCVDVFSGRVTADQPCTMEAECAPGLYCSGGPDTCGLCVARYPLGGPCWGPTGCQVGLLCTDGRCTGTLRLGQGCTGTTTPCPAGSMCFPPFPPLGVCTALGVEGADCQAGGGFSLPCAPGLVCSATDGGTHCLGPGEEGAACDSAGQRAPRCHDDGVRLYCDATTQRCAAVRVSPAGGACGASSICRADERCVSGTCTPRPRAGDACSAGAAEACFDSACTGGRCVAAARLGEPCDAGCPGLHCVAAACGAEACDGGRAWDAGGWAPDAGALVAP